MNSKSKEINSAILKKLNEKRDKLLANGRLYDDSIDLSNNGTILIRPEEKEQYDTIMQLISFLDFEKYDKDSTYLFPGTRIGKGKKVTICVKEENIEKIIRQKDKFRSLLGITFPDQLFQYQYKDELIPGKEYKPPRPQLIEETDEEYEAFLKDYYARNNESQEFIPNSTDIRAPYIHEKIKYETGNQIDENHTSEYYQGYMKNSLNKTQPKPQSQNPRAKENVEYEFKESTPGAKIPFFQKFGTLNGSIKENLSSGLATKKLRTILGIGLVAGATGIVAVNVLNLPVVLLAAGVAASVKIFTPLGKKLVNKIRNKLYGEPIVQTPPTQQQPEPQSQPTQGQHGPQSQPTPPKQGPQSPHSQNPETEEEITEKINNLLRELGDQNNTYRDLCTRIKIEEEKLNNLDPQSEEYKVVMKTITELKEQQKTMLKNLHTILKNYGETKSNGGPKL